ncbi:MAG: choice-of-anchor I family protein [Flavobacterium sp.]
MTHNYKKAFLPLLMVTAFMAQAQTLLHSWNFNGLPTGTITTAVVADYSLPTGTTSITYPGTGTGYVDRVEGDVLNAETGIIAGYALRPRNPSNTRELLIAFPTTGYRDVVMTFATTKTSAGATEQTYSYSLDNGATYITTGLPVTTYSPVTDTYTLVTLDFSAIAEIDNAANVIIKVNFGGTAAAGNSGNNRFDNIAVKGTLIPSEQLVHYWNFNTLPSGSITAPVAADFSLLSTANTSITYPGTGAGYVDRVDPGDIINVQDGAPAGYGYRPRNPSNTREVRIAFPTTGYEDIKVKFATTRTTQGATEQTYSYSIDGGTTFITTGLPVTSYSPVADIYNLVTLDLSGITTVNNIANVILKISFGGTTASGTSGNNRFDNITVHGVALPGTVDVTPPTVTIVPDYNAVNIAVNSEITIAFNEAVRLLNDNAITNTNVDALVQLRLNDVTGALVPFDATFADNTITVVPTGGLLNNQHYYVELLGNTIEDMSGNALQVGQSSVFKTIAVQTPLTAGDIIPVAYRMSATGAEDAIALLALVDIAPGTFIHLADNKYTTNAQPQCPGGFDWTATTCVPAGTVIVIQTDAGIASTGSIDENADTFGMSSGGDQVIIYTGTAAAPNYITAMTSNGWAATNTICDGSISMLPATLVDGTSSVNLTTAPGNVAGNSANAYYSGPMTGTPAAIRTAVLNPANWVAAAGSTAPQTWPTWAFPGSPTVQNATVTNNTTITLTFNNALNAASAATIANYTGVAGLTGAALNGNVVTLSYGTPFVSGTSYTLTVNGVTDTNGLQMACAYTYTFSYNTTIKFDSDFIVVNENHGTLALNLTLANPATGSVDVVLKGSAFNTADSGDFTYATQTLNFTGNSTLTQTINIPIIDDAVAEQQAEYFVLSLENPTGLAITGETLATIYIKDNDVQAPVPSQSIQLDYVGSFDPSGAGSSTCEIVVHDPVSQRLFTTSAVAGYLDIINFANPANPVVINSINMNSYGGVTSVAVKNGIVAVASPNTLEHLDGSVVFMTTDGVFQKQVTVGALPDNISFTPDGTKVLTANEGQPNSDYSIDPEGSVSIIDISGGIAALTQANVTTLGFQAYNTPTAEAALIASGVRKLKLTSTMSQDLEPEYITTSADSQKAWVTLQENNAIAEINLTNNTIASVWALGTKDMSLPGNGFDISDNNQQVLIANWPIKTFYMPDAVASYNLAGTNYIVTANEGDEKEYTGFEERTTLGAASYLLDAVAYPQAAMLKKSQNAGRFRVSNLSGNTDADAEFEQMYAVGSRSFSIFNADTKQLVYDSGDDFEMYTSMEPSISALFNSDHENNSFKSRSRAKGPEPEGVTIAQLAGKTFAFVSLERVGGVMVYDVTDPNAVVFVDYKNSRSVSAYTGDHGPEGITFIPGTQSPDGKNYIIVANEISGTLTIFEIDTTNLSTGDFTAEAKTFNVFPNPNVDGLAYFNRAADIEVYDFSGKLVHSAKQALTINTSRMAAGIYLIKTSEGIVKKLIVK